MAQVFPQCSFKSRWQEWRSSKDSLRRFFLGLFVFLFLLSAFYFRDARVDELKAGALSTRFSINQVDFKFLDKQSTQQLKQQARFEIGSIYRIDERTLYLQTQAIKGRLAADPQWQEVHPECNYQQLGSMLDVLASQATKIRISDEGTIQKIKMLGMKKDLIFFSTSNAFENLPASFWSNLASRNDGVSIPESCLNLCIHQLESTHFILNSDSETEFYYQNLAMNQVNPVYTQFKAGDIILTPGERVSERHVDIFKAMKESLNRSFLRWDVSNFFFSFALAIVTLGVCVLYLRYLHAEIYFSFKKLILLVSILVISLVFGKAVEFFLFHSDIAWREAVRYPAIYALSAILVSLLVCRNLVSFATLFLIVYSWFFFTFVPERFAILNFIAAFSATICMQKVYRRRQIFTGVIKIWISIVPVLLAFHVIDNDLTWHSVSLDLFGDFAYLCGMGLIIILVLPGIERLFHVLTNMSLTEYLDPSNELLRRISIEAPGTYQHSIIVGHLSEAAARSISANELFCRVATLYHDAGKLYHPQYFTENQMGGFNIHQLLTPKESAQVIISHVSEGEILAKKYGIPQQFIDIINEHHGTTLVKYFYAKEIELQGDSSKVDQAEFRYKGPKPKTKESAIIMIADCVEAASRSLDSTTVHSIEQLIDKIIKDKVFDAQFDECQLTFEDLGKIRKAMAKALMVTHHIRVQYPSKESLL